MVSADMKITGQTIPPELAADYAKYLTAKPLGAGATFNARTKKGVLNPPSAIKQKRQNSTIEGAVDYLILFLKNRTRITPSGIFRYLQIQQIRQGIFDPEWWIECEIVSEQIIEETPTTIPFTGTRSYSYPVPWNTPTMAIYGNGTNSSGIPSFFGSTVGTEYSDKWLKWKRTIFDLKNAFNTVSDEPVFLKMNGSIHIVANARPSHAMLSAHIKQFFVEDGSTRLTTKEPPLNPCISAFFRYKMPHGEAPYYDYTHPLSLMYSLRTDAREEIGVTLSKCIVLTSPMPMMGWRWNNNESVSTELNATLELWQINKKILGVVGQSSLKNGDSHAFTWSAFGMADLGTLGGTFSTATAISTDGSAIVGTATDLAGLPKAFRLSSSKMHDLGTLGGNFAVGNAISANGLTITGMSGTAGIENHAYRWTSTSMDDLGTLGGDSSEGLSISASGLEIAGTSKTAGGDLHAFWWDSLGMIDIGTLGGTFSAAKAISADGLTVIGDSSTTLGENHAFVWTSGGIVDLGTLGGDYSTAAAISADGLTICGTSTTLTGEAHAFAWTISGMVDLGTLGGESSNATAISANGLTIAGHSSNLTGDTHAFYWNLTGMVDIGTLGGVYAFVTAISTDGSTIVGYSQNTAEMQHAFIWTSEGMQDIGTLGGDTSTTTTLSG